MRDFKPELQTFTSDTIPSAYEHQIRSFIRIEWWDSYQHSVDPPLGNPSFQPINFVLVEGDCLYSAAKVNRTQIEHQGQIYVCYGLGGVFTYPAFRQRGYGAWVVREATEYIRQQSDADIAVLWTLKRNIPFYERNGWEHYADIRMMIGDPQKPYRSSEELMMLFVSETAQANHQQFKSQQVYFGVRAW
jgi:GNAT superfamily N-acetyltransferase